MHSPYTGASIKLPVSEMLKTIPEFFGLRLNEEPTYRVECSLGDVEIRRYDPIVSASVAQHGGYEASKEEAFKRLASYIFGENDGQEQLAMTAPVLLNEIEPVHASTAWSMTFILPKKVTADNLPKPIDPSIQLSHTSSRLVATLRYGGTNTLESMHANWHLLEKALAEQTRFRTVGSPWWAQYDAPFVLPVAKRNEVQIEVVEVEA